MKKPLLLVIFVFLITIFSSLSFADNYFNYTTDAHGLSWQGSGSGFTTAECSQIYSKIDGLLINVTTQSDTTYTRARLFNQSRILINTASISSHYAFLNYSIKANNVYYVCFDNSGASYTSKYQTVVSFPYIKRNINFNYTYLYDGVTWTPDPNMRDIETISTAILLQTGLQIISKSINPSYWNTPIINLTWNVSGAQNGTITIYRNGIINQSLFYQPIGNNTSQIINIFNIWDNISYELLIENNLGIYFENSNTIQIMPPLTNYISILNNSDIFKQNLTSNISETNKNESLYYWRINNTIVKYGLDFNISDYNTSYLGKNITFCINSTVPSQNYSLENCSSNYFTIGQIINFTARRIYDGLQIQNFSICSSLGCVRTTNYYIDLYNYNISDNYYLNTTIYQNMNVTLTSNITYQNYTFTPFDAQSIYFSILNMQGTPINQLSTISIYGNYFNYNLTTLNGYANISLLYPDTYKMTVVSNGYNTNDFYLNIVANTYNQKIVYLSNSSLTTQMRFNVFEQISGAKLEGYKIIAQYFINGTWNSVAECTTNDQGYCYLNLLKYNFYKYYVYSSSDVITPVKVVPVESANYANDERNFLISLKNNVLDEYSFYDKLTLIDFSYTNISRNYTFRAEFSFTNPISSVCIHVYRNTIQGKNDTYCRFCTFTSPATIFCNANLISNYTYYADLYDITSNQTFNLQQYILTFSDTRNKFSFIGMFFTLLIVLVGALLGLPDVAKSLAGCILGLTLSSLIGFINLPFGVIIILIIIAIITLVRPRGAGAP